MQHGAVFTGKFGRYLRTLYVTHKFKAEHPDLYSILQAAIILPNSQWQEATSMETFVELEHRFLTGEERARRPLQAVVLIADSQA